MNLVRRNREALDQLALRELRDRHHRRCAAGCLARQPAPARAFAQSEPLGVRDERQIVNGHDGWCGDSERRGVGRREPDVEMIRHNRTRDLYLFPPRSGSAGDGAGGEAPRIEGRADLVPARTGRTREREPDRRWPTRAEVRPGSVRRRSTGRTIHGRRCRCAWLHPAGRPCPPPFDRRRVRVVHAAGRLGPS